MSYEVTIIEKKTGQIHKETLPVSDSPTDYEYGKALADVLEPFISGKIGATAEVREDDWLIHALAIVPKGGAVMVTENAGADTLPLQKVFRREADTLPEKYLVCVNPEHNNNKYYRMVDLNDGTWGAFYGRIGEEQGSSRFSKHATVPYVYPAYMYYIKLQEKLLKGYQDMTELHVAGSRVSVKSEYKPIENDQIRILVDRLMRFASKVVEKNYTISASDVTQQMIDAAKKELAALRKLKSVAAFNKHLVRLMHILPRRIDGEKNQGVQRMLAEAQDSFAAIILRESNLLQIMEGQVNVATAAAVNGKADPTKTILDALGLEIYEARPEQVEVVRSHLGATLKPRLKSVYRVINKRTQKKFDEYLENNKVNGKKPKVKQLWHGSGNENWFSILQNGLMLNPDAKITGKMFGAGIYFAPSDMKSYNYTSGIGSYWRRGTSDVAFMGLYATAYGTPYDVFDYVGINFSSFDYDALQAKQKGASCLHAHSDHGMLRSDEIVFYKENQLTINYLCEFAA